ncbi:MAG: sulfatase-like hydrolase/transferase, partial [Planctomycetota bacterium]
ALHRWTPGVPAKWKAGALAAAAVAYGTALLPSASAERGGPACFLLVATDSLRADHLSCNGYPRETTPHIDELARRGTNFARCLVPTASTHESWVSMLSSSEPRHHGLRHMFPARDEVRSVVEGREFLPALLADRGYATGAVGGWCGTTFRLFDMGFREVDVSDAQTYRTVIAEAAFTNHLLACAVLDNPLGRLLVPELAGVSFTRSASALTRRAKAFLDRMAREQEPFFLVVVYHVTHLPYSASYPYYATFTDPAYRGRNRYRIDFNVDEMIQHGFCDDLTAAERRHVVDLYDGCVREFDEQVGALVRHLKARGLYGRTIVGVVGDHGDDLYEPGCTLGHGVTLFGGDHANHIPAVFAGPGIPARRVDELVRSFDLTPTWARWLGVEAPPSWHGADLAGEIPRLSALLETSYLLYRQPVPDLRAGERPREFPRFDRAVVADPAFDGNFVLRRELRDLLVKTKCFAVREGPWKLIYVPGEEGPIYRLYHLDKDPLCVRDLSAARPGELERLKAMLPPEAR